MKLSRRDFIKASTLSCLSVACIAADQPQQKELEKKRLSKYTLLFASPYSSANHRYTPHMHQELKNNIEEMSNGLIYVDVQDRGLLGVGTELMAKVTRGHVDAALISGSNLSPALPVLDIINIPYWCAENKDYLNLITSNSWQKHVIDPIKKQAKIEILLHYIPGPRTITTTRAINQAVRSPEDLNRLIFRVPASKTLTSFYEMTKANIVNVPWADVSYLSKHGRIEALDPSIIGLYAGPNNLKQHLGIISRINSVQDAWFTVINQNWLKSLPINLQIVVKEAANKTFRQHLNKIDDINNNCINAFKQLDTNVYTPSEDEIAKWRSAFGYQRAEWNLTKERLLGSVTAFDSLLEATKT